MTTATPPNPARAATWLDFVAAYQPGDFECRAMDRLCAIWETFATDQDKRTFLQPCVAHASPSEQVTQTAALIFMGDAALKLHRAYVASVANKEADIGLQPVTA